MQKLTQPRLSFIIPVYNTEHILARCIKALLDQSLKEWEAIFVLDGESAIARDIITNAFKGRDNFKIITIEHTGTTGSACRARNAGAKEAVGEYWVFWDSDCIIEPGTAKLWVDTLDKKQDIDFVYSAYRFLNEMGAASTEDFDPWLLRVGNYISGCFPFRAKLFPGWDESLESLQDWDLWLSIVEKGGRGYAFSGYGFATEFPTLKSISGRGCASDVWLSRVDAVKKKHNIPDRKVCVTSVQNKHEAIRLAKLIDADYRQEPNYKPHRYETIIQVGFSLRKDLVVKHADIFSAKNNDAVKRRIIFWTSDNILDMWRMCNMEAIDSYSKLLNDIAISYVEDKTAAKMLNRAGFNCEILPLPVVLEGDVCPLPEKPTFVVDVEDAYGPAMSAIDKSIPDATFELLSGAKPLKEYTGLINFFTDRSMSEGIKRALINGRHVVSNVQQPFCGFVDDRGNKEKFIVSTVRKIREIMDRNTTASAAADYYKKALGPEKLLEALK